jgi:hypothetical protein
LNKNLKILKKLFKKTNDVLIPAIHTHLKPKQWGKLSKKKFSKNEKLLTRNTWSYEIFRFQKLFDKKKKYRLFLKKNLIELKKSIKF